MCKDTLEDTVMQVLKVYYHLFRIFNKDYLKQV